MPNHIHGTRISSTESGNLHFGAFFIYKWVHTNKVHWMKHTIIVYKGAETIMNTSIIGIHFIV